MKTFLLLLISLFFITNISAQLIEPEELEENKTTSEKEIKKSLIFGGFGLVFNQFGFGGGVEFQMAKHFTGFANAGIGGWGYKLDAGINIYPKGKPYGSAFTIGYAHATGAEDVEVEMEVNSMNNMQEIVMDYEQCGTVNIAYSYYFKLGKLKSKIGITTGLAFPTVSEPYTIKTPNVELTQTSKSVLDLMQPGGLIFGVRFMF